MQITQPSILKSYTVVNMNTPGNPGWGVNLLLTNASPEDRLFELARLQKKCTDSLSADLVYDAYGFAKQQLEGKVDLPDDLGDVRVTLYENITYEDKVTGGGLMYYLPGSGDRDVAIRTELYKVEGDKASPAPPFSIEHAVETLEAANRLKRACIVRLAGVYYDLTTIKGMEAAAPKIIQVPQPIDS